MIEPHETITYWKLAFAEAVLEAKEELARLRIQTKALEKERERWESGTTLKTG